MEHEALIRLGAFLVIFTVMSVWESFAPRRVLVTSKRNRWVNNLALLSLNPISLRLIFSILPVSLALLAEQRHWGLLNQIVLPDGVELMIGVLSLDFTIYLQHVLFHSIPTLWRLHMVHHTDLDFDVTTGVRFHPLEIILSMGIKLMAVIALGPAPVAVLLFEVALSATSLFNHSNIFLPLKADRVLRFFVVTPEMHRVHHSVVIQETNSNFGFSFPWWDRLFGTYRPQPSKGHVDMVIGLAQYREPKHLNLWQLIIMPFTGNPGKVPISRH